MTELKKSEARKRRLVAPKPTPANVPELPTYGEAVAVRAVSLGEASKEQQLTAFRFIVERACGTFREAFDESQRMTDFMLGRIFVGQQLIGVTKLNLSQLQKQEAKLNG